MKESIIYLDTPSEPEFRMAEIFKPKKSFMVEFSDNAKIVEINFNGKYVDILYSRPKIDVDQRIHIQGTQLIGDIDLTKDVYILKMYSNNYCKTVTVETTGNNLTIKR